VNFAAEAQRFHVAEAEGGIIVISTATGREGQPASGLIELGPDEAVVIQA
jgi:hypothetical protein